MIKVYVHNYYDEKLFLTIAHNSINRVYNIDNRRIGNVICEYNGNCFEFIFNPSINDNSDGYHLIEFFSILKQYNLYENFSDLKFDKQGKEQDIKIIQRIIELISNKKDWIFLYLRTEKILAKTDIPDLELNSAVDELLQKLKNHKIISDNVFLKDEIEQLYPNFFYTFTNSIYNWNDLIGIRWFYEYKNLFENINKPYDIGFSIRRFKGNRRKILKLLKEQNNEKMYLSFTDFFIEFEDQPDKIENFLKINVNYNSKLGDNDFDNLTNINNLHQIGLDLFFRILPKSKMQILDESWAWRPVEYTHQYISEKTIGYLLACIPFISTHIYPLDIVHKVLKLEKHPFYDDMKVCYGDVNKFCNFVKIFLEDFDKNYLLCLDWSKKAHIKVMEKILSKNDLLDLIQTNFKKEIEFIPKKLL